VTGDLLPFLTLFVGVAIVIGLIIGARINAFLALIVAALIVSLMADGDIGAKVGRVADAFGRMVGGIGIIIALAAVVGKFLTDSGAADRIVRSCLNALGERRAPGALAGSGFVLSVPVFFDTVFYLLIPLARSLYRSTQRNYLKFVLAILAGAAVTHTLVPPTPGPLLMSQQLGVPLGTMIIFGALIGVPATLVGLLFASWLDRRMSIPMRALPGESPLNTPAETTKPRQYELPGLWISLLPILLPVLLIGISAALETRAVNERAAVVLDTEVIDWSMLQSALATAAPQSRAAALGSQLSVFSIDQPETESMRREVLNRWLAQRTPEQLRKNLAVVEHENRLVLEALLPAEAFPRHDWDTPKRRAYDNSRLYGNPNFALLLAAALAMILYIRVRRPSRQLLGEAMESAVISAGPIILITAAGGAFGAMLEVAQVGPAVERLFTRMDLNSGGVGLMVLGFFIASILKVAQGSTTVAVIVASSMIATMVDFNALSFNPVYLVTAIGGGGLVGSWMNDSGFWIFARMGGFTEAETLRSWTPMLAVLGLTIFVTSVLLAVLFPMPLR
jgi:GntP family gluconate:H+ symporter